MNQNAEMISRAIADMNAYREQVAQNTIKSLINNIVATQVRKAEAIAQCDAAIADYKKQLAAVTIVPVIAADIVG